MTSESKGREPAFPNHQKLWVNRDGELLPTGDDHHSGMSLRDYASLIALQGLIAMTAHPESGGPPDPTVAARKSFEYADAWLAAQEQTDADPTKQIDLADVRRLRRIINERCIRLRSHPCILDRDMEDALREIGFEILESEGEAPEEPQSESEPRCYDCGLPYSDPGFADLVVPHEVWNARISPTGDGGGLLCPTCMVRAGARAEVRCPEAEFRSGPFSIDFDGPVLARQPESGEQEWSCIECGAMWRMLTRGDDLVCPSCEGVEVIQVQEVDVSEPDRATCNCGRKHVRIEVDGVRILGCPSCMQTPKMRLAINAVREAVFAQEAERARQPESEPSLETLEQHPGVSAEYLARQKCCAASEALDQITAMLRAPDWEYPGQVVRDVQRALRETPSNEPPEQPESGEHFLRLYGLCRDMGMGSDPTKTGMEEVIDFVASLRDESGEQEPVDLDVIERAVQGVLDGYEMGDQDDPSDWENLVREILTVAAPIVLSAPPSPLQEDTHCLSGETYPSVSGP